MNDIARTVAMLRDWAHCPRCLGQIAASVCMRCGLVLNLPEAAAVARASETAARALVAREQALAKLVAAGSGAHGAAPQMPSPGALPASQSLSHAAGARPAAMQPFPLAADRSAFAQPNVGAGAPLPSVPPLASPADRPAINQVAVFSGVGVGALVAAAMVFAWLVPLEVAVVRAVLVAVTLASIGAMLWLRRRRPVSASAVAVGVILLSLLTVNVIVSSVPHGAWFAAAGAVAVLGVGFGAAGFFLKLRPWASASPLLATFAGFLSCLGFIEAREGGWPVVGTTMWPLAGGIVLTGMLAASGRLVAYLWRITTVSDAPGRLPGIGDSAGEYGTAGRNLPHAAIRWLLSIIGAGALAVAGFLAVIGSLGEPPRALSGAILLGCAVMAGLHGLDKVWGGMCGACLVLAAGTLVFGLSDELSAGVAAVALVWTLLAAVSWQRGLRNGRISALLIGSAITVVVVAAPLAAYLLSGMLGAVLGADIASLGWVMPSAAWATGALGAVAIAAFVASRLPAPRFGTSIAMSAPAGSDPAPIRRPGQIPPPGLIPAPSRPQSPGQIAPMGQILPSGQILPPAPIAPSGQALPQVPTQPIWPSQTVAALSTPVVPRVGRALWPWLTLACLATASILPPLLVEASVALLLTITAVCGVLAWWLLRRGVQSPRAEFIASPLNTAQSARPQEQARGLSPQSGDPHGFVNPQSARPHERARGLSPQSGVILAAARIGGALVGVAALSGSWYEHPLALIAGAVGVVIALAWTCLTPLRARPVVVAVAVAYGIVVAGYGLWWYPFGWNPDDPVPVICLVAIGTCVTSVATALIRRIPDPVWHAVLGVGLLPWIAAITTVAQQRTWWAAAAAGAMLVSTVAILSVRRRRQAVWLRVGAASVLLPLACVMVINVGSMLISGSGSPALLPVVAALTVVAAVVAAPWTAALAARGVPLAATRGMRAGLEVSALVTGLISAGLSIGRPATGPDTTLLVCAVLAAGASVVALRPDRRLVWWLAGLGYAGVLWSALVLWDIAVVEAYTAPVAAAALLVGVLLVRRAAMWWSLAAAGLLLGIVPTLALTIAGSQVGVRGLALVLLAVVLTGATAWLGHDPAGWRRVLQPVANSSAALAALTPIVLACWASATVAGYLPRASANDEFIAVFARLAAQPEAAFAAVAGTAWLAVPLIGFQGQLARRLASTGRLSALFAEWRFAPALVVGALGPVIAIIGLQAWRHHAPPSLVWPLWALAIGFLAVPVISCRLRLGGRLVLPPVWFSWLAALAVGITSWSLRDLRVEWHSLPLGMTLFLCGFLAWRDTRLRREPASSLVRPSRLSGVEERSDEHTIWPSKPARWAWPVGITNPATLIVPGVLATLGPSTIAIWTDPQTWRAILVLALAIGFLLLGARKLWRACMTAATVDLAVAIVLVFVARSDRIDWVPWMIALVGAGGVLLGLAIYTERRQSLRPAPGG